MKGRLLALVTGGGSGIGEATARTLARRGISVVVADANKTAAEGVANDISKKFDVVAHGLRADVSDENSVKELV